MSTEVKRPQRLQFEPNLRCKELSSNDTGMEKAPFVAGRGRAGMSIGDKRSRRSASFSCAGTKSEGHKLQYLKKRRFIQTDRQNGTVQIENFKRRRLGSMDARSKDKIVLPTKFLLGGNINDPLNLNSLNDEEINRVLNEKTPQSSPVPMPAHRMSVEVMIPVNIHDPLNLNGGDDSSDIIVKSYRKRKRHRPKKKEHAPSTCLDGVDVYTSANKAPEKQSNNKDALREALKIEVEPAEVQNSSYVKETQPPSSEKTQQSITILSKAAKIVSPVIRQLNPKLRKRRRTISECGVNLRCDVSRALFRRSSSPNILRIVPQRKLKRQISGSSKTFLEETVACVQKNIPKRPQFIHGNYNRYYGYRNPQMEKDHRLIKMKQEWFNGKDVLDIGCNVGHITLAIAHDFKPRKVIGTDIDHNLIRAARHNIRNFLAQRHDLDKFPSSSAINYGPITAPPLADSITGFPRNVMFMQANYVLERDEQIDMVREEFDTILALSLTKWLHLNNGDAGLKRAFHRMFRQLRPNGRLILEPQPWASYRKRKKLTEAIFKNYQSIELRPEQFRQYLLTEVGFSKCEVIDIPFNKSKGFRRPLLLFTKMDTQYSSPATAGFSTPSALRQMHGETSQNYSRECNPSKCISTSECSLCSTRNSSCCSSYCNSPMDIEKSIISMNKELRNSCVPEFLPLGDTDNSSFHVQFQKCADYISILEENQDVTNNLLEIGCSSGIDGDKCNLKEETITRNCNTQTCITSGRKIQDNISCYPVGSESGSLDGCNRQVISISSNEDHSCLLQPEKEQEGYKANSFDKINSIEQNITPNASPTSEEDFKKPS